MIFISKRNKDGFKNKAYAEKYLWKAFAINSRVLPFKYHFTFSPHSAYTYNKKYTILAYNPKRKWGTRGCISFITEIMGTTRSTEMACLLLWIGSYILKNVTWLFLEQSSNGFRQVRTWMDNIRVYTGNGTDFIYPPLIDTRHGNYQDILLLVIHNTVPSGVGMQRVNIKNI